MNTTTNRSNPVGLLLVIGFATVVILGSVVVGNLPTTSPQINLGGEISGAASSGTVSSQFARGLSLSTSPVSNMYVEIPGEGYLSLDAIAQSNLPEVPDLSGIDPNSFNNFPGLEQVIPDLQDHAAMRRAMATMPLCEPKSAQKAKPNPNNTGLMKVSMSYDYVTSGPTEIYFSPYLGRVYIFRDNPCGDPIHQLLGVVMDAAINNGTVVGYSKVVTVLTDNVDRDQVISSSCATIKVWQNLEYLPEHNPPTLGGKGKCLTNHLGQ